MKPGSENASEIYKDELKKKLSELMDVERSDQDADIVKSIIESDLEDEEKIKRIVEIDSRTIDNKLNEATIGKKELEGIIRRNSIITREASAEYCQKIKSYFLRRPFFYFLFPDYKRIREFAKKTGTLRLTVIPPKIRLEKEVKDELLKYQREASGLLTILVKMLKVAWATLEKKDYNLLVKFKELCEAVITTKVATMPFTDKGLIARFRETERLFLICHYNPEYPEIIAGSIKQVLLNSPQWADKADNVVELARKLLEQKDDAICLYNVIRAVNMSEKRHYFELKELINYETLNIINTYEFDTDKETAMKINTYVQDKLRKYSVLLKARKEVERVKNFLGQFISQEEGKVDFRLLRSFYRAAGSDDQLNFSIDRKNAAEFSQNFFKFYINFFKEFLTGKIVMKDFGPIQIFTPDFFGDDIKKMITIFQKLSKAYFVLPKFSMDRYIDIITAGKASEPQQTEENMTRLISGLSSICVRIGKKLAYISLRHEDNIRDIEDFDNIAPIDVSALSSKRVGIPYWSKEVLTEGIFFNNTFGQAMNFVVSISFLTGLFFQDSEFDKLLKKDRAVSQEEDKIRFELERLSDVETYEQIKRIFFY